jgi:hypothetical protein
MPASKRAGVALGTAVMLAWLSKPMIVRRAMPAGKRVGVALGTTAMLAWLSKPMKVPWSLGEQHQLASVLESPLAPPFG